ncbi:MAG: LytTR family transcriptional regulator [Bacteroidia bacterium]|nr:LytTR family transcriptional regulator [Bacteroidia bacterium]
MYSSMGYQVVGRIIFPDFEEELDPLICGTTGGRRRIGKRSQDLFRNERARVVLQKLFLPCGKDIQLIDLDEVSFIQAGKGKSWVIFQDGRKEKTQLKFSQIRRMLTGGSFVQVNENTLINSRQVKFFERESHEMRPQPQQFAVLENGERITVIPSLRGGLFAKISEWQLDQ